VVAAARGDIRGGGVGGAGRLRGASVGGAVVLELRTRQKTNQLDYDTQAPAPRRQGRQRRPHLPEQEVAS
jgi:hypothetical protein